MTSQLRAAMIRLLLLTRLHYYDRRSFYLLIRHPRQRLGLFLLFSATPSYLPDRKIASESSLSGKRWTRPSEVPIKALASSRRATT